MPRIAEKLEFMKMTAGKVCTKARDRRIPGNKNPCFRANFQ
jgi:hypothetical protein